MATPTKGTPPRAPQTGRGRGAVKMIFWLIISAVLISYTVWSYTSGQMVRWYYYKASVDGYAVDANSFAKATKQNPAQLGIVKTDEIKGLQAVAVKTGDRLPAHANGVITPGDLKAAKRVSLDATTNSIKVMVPSQVKESKGFKYKDTYKHKGIQTNPWSGVWNVCIVLLLGLSLGLLAEGITDTMGLKIEKIDHAVAH